MWRTVNQAPVEEESDTELTDSLNVGEKIDEMNSNKSLPAKKRKIENVTVENNEIAKQKNDSQKQWIGYCKIQHMINMKFCLDLKEELIYFGLPCFQTSRFRPSPTIKARKLVKVALNR